MSKSIGNVVDPVDVIGQYGTDALRFTLATGMPTQLTSHHSCPTSLISCADSSVGVYVLVHRPLSAAWLICREAPQIVLL